MWIAIPRYASPIPADPRKNRNSLTMRAVASKITSACRSATRTVRPMMGFRKLPECHLPVLVRFMGRPTEGDQDPELNAIALDAYGRVGTGRLAVWCLPGAGLSAPWSSSQLAPAVPLPWRGACWLLLNLTKAYNSGY